MPKNIYAFTLEQPYQRNFEELINLDNLVFKDDRQREWFSIKRDGTLTVNKDYSWDGCSPKFRIGPVLMGVWDGPIQDSGRPLLWEASLVHDALCQYNKKYKVPFSRKMIDELFLKLMLEVQWEQANLYYKAVSLHRCLRFL